jgi:phenylacetate-CoA ligase
MSGLAKAVLERVYPRLDVRSQNALISTYGYVYRRRRLGGEFPRLVSEFVERDRWPAERMRAYVEEQLRRMASHAWERVPHYRRAWAGAGIDPAVISSLRLEDLPILPIVAKAELRCAPETFLARGELRWRVPLLESTSGSTGEPVTVTSTAALQRAYLAAREARSFRWAGASLLLSKATIGGRGVVPRADSPGPYYRYNRAERQCYLSAFHISPRNVEAYVGALRRHRARVLTGYASSYFCLARMMLAQGLTLGYQPDCLVLCADQLTAEMKPVIYEALRARPYEEYGSVENAMLATECEFGSLHAHPDFGILEIVDSGGRPVPPGQDGRIVCTSLLNRVQPLIRYDVGDIGRWTGLPCPCGRDHLPVLEEIVGRVEDVITGPDGREIVRLCSLQGVPRVLASQIVQYRADAITVRVVAAEGFGAAEETQIREILGTRRLGGVRIDIERVTELEKTPAGKVRRVIQGIPTERSVSGAA